MAIKKYMTLERLQEYDDLIKAEIEEADASTLASAKSYTDSAVAGKANSSHTHDDRYYTESEIDTKLSAKADSDHNHDTAYDVKGAADTALASAKSYADTKVSGLASTTVVDNKITTHNTSTTAHSDIRDLISALTTKVNNFLDVDDTTTDQLSEVLTLIENNKGTLDSLTSGKVNVSDIVDNLTTSNASKVLSAKQGVELKALIDALQGVVDGKVDANHTHDDRYYTEVEIDSKIDDLNSAISGKADSGHIHTVADTSNDGFMSAAMVGKLEGIEENANKTIVDSALSTTSANPVANSAVTSALNTATEAIGLNTQSITAHTQSINTLQEEFDSIQEITSQEIQDLFRA